MNRIHGRLHSNLSSWDHVAPGLRIAGQLLEGPKTLDHLTLQLRSWSDHSQTSFLMLSEWRGKELHKAIVSWRLMLEESCL